MSARLQFSSIGRGDSVDWFRLTPASSFQESWQCAFVAIVITTSLFAVASVWRLVRGPIYAARSTDFESSFPIHVLMHVPHAEIEVQLVQHCNCTRNGDTKVRQKQDKLVKTFNGELTRHVFYLYHSAYLPPPWLKKLRWLGQGRGREGRKEGRVNIQCSRMTTAVLGQPGILMTCHHCRGFHPI